MTRNISWNFLKSDELCLASFVSLRPTSNSGSIVGIKMLSSVSDEDLLLPRDKLIKAYLPKKIFLGLTCIEWRRRDVEELLHFRVQSIGRYGLKWQLLIVMSGNVAISFRSKTFHPGKKRKANFNISAKLIWSD